MKRARAESYADEFAQLVEEDRQAERDAQDVVEMERVMALRDSNETRSRLNASAASSAASSAAVAAEERLDDHREVDHMIALIQEEDDANDRERDLEDVFDMIRADTARLRAPLGPAPAAAPQGPQQGPPLGPPLGPPEAPRGFQPDVDVFDGEVDTDDEDDGGVAPMAVDSYDDLLNPDKHRIGPAYGTYGYARPEAPPITPSEEDFVFMQTECTYAIDPQRMIPILRVWGLTERGNSVLYEDDTFAAYFYAAITRHSEAEAVRAKLDAYLATQYNTRQKNGRVAGGKFVVSMTRCEGRSICGYVPDEDAMTPMYKFVMAHPAHVAAARNSLEYTNRAVTERPIKTFEANVPYELRWLIDKRINGCQWIRLRQGTYTRTGAHSTAQYVLKIAPGGAGAEPIDLSEKDAVAPMRYLSFDIEVYRRRKGFPTAKEDPCIMIANALFVVGVGIVHRVIFTVRPQGKDFGPIEDDEDGAEMFVYNTEAAMLLAWQRYVIECDPDAFTGWNTSNFDFPYLAERARQCGVSEEFMCFSRIRNKATWMRQSTFSSKAHGSRETTEILCEGRFDYDGLTFMLKGQMEKYRSYKLNYISKKVLGKQKLDLDYTQIPVLYDSVEDDDRTRLAQYCVRDALLPLMLLDKLMAVVNGIEQARVTGVPIKWLLARGQGIKTFSNLLRYKAPWQHPPSRSPKSNTVVTAGGHVEEPLRGFYLYPTASQDFSSLYPSIMIAYNVCFSTKVSLAWAREHLKPDDYWVPYPSVDKKTAEEIEREKISTKTKSKKERDREELEQTFAGLAPDFCFVKRHIREGVLPRLLETLLAARVNVKNMMKQPKAKADKMYMSVLDGRQLALKVVCNSVYGFLKAFILTDKDLMAAVTSYGRNMLRRVKEVIKEQFSNIRVVDVPRCTAMGIDPETEPKEGEEDMRPYTTTSAFVVYGDTDSVMVNYGNVTLSDCAKYGAQIAERCTARFERPNTLVFEAVKLRGLFMNKKRYAALEIEKYIPGERMDAAIARAKVSLKGLEGKRRDNAAIGSDTQNAIVKILLKEGDVAKAERYVIDVMTELNMGRVDMSKLVISKGLTKTAEQYEKGGTKQQHVELQKRMRKRAHITGEAVGETGDRIPFVMLAGTAKKTGKGASKACELSEDPLYAQRTGAPIDREYYQSKQLWPACARVFTCVYEPLKCMEIHSAMSLDDKKKLKVYRKLFAPGLPHMRSIVKKRMRDMEDDHDHEDDDGDDEPDDNPGAAKKPKPKPKKNAKAFGMFAHAIVLPQCMSCRTRVSAEGDAVCRHCDLAKTRAAKAAEYEKRKVARDEAWDICRKCQPGKHQNPKECSAVMCENFFHRDRTLMDIEDIEKDLRRLK